LVEKAITFVGFIGLDPGLASKPSPPRLTTGDVYTILFTDIASSTALTQRLGDAKAQELVRAHNKIVREALATHGGSEIKHTGDGIMASFPSASGALECAVAIQRAIAVHNQSAGPGGLDPRPSTPDPLSVHIGLNAGEPLAEEQDLFGTAVQLARRICDHAEAGQVLVSNVVRELAAGKGFLFGDIGEVVPKGFEEPVRLYEVRWREGG
jgi:class 3 adenylate cyclase